ncbi:MAG: DEAD/DEAH box helicase [Microthrixaceae bacterium]|nr:DEAD/DEAH box helicase [Microthrixaceae bacterium]
MSLATQVRDELTAAAHARGIRVGAIYGGDPIEKQIKALRSGIDLAVCTPGRAIDLIERGDLSVADVSRVVIDEADRMADMGFLPQVEWILRNVEGKHQTLLFSATLDGVVDSLVKRYQHDPTRHEAASKGVSIDRMTHLFLKVHEMDKVKVTASIIKGTDRVLVFSATKHGADRLARKLAEEGVQARAIHGDLRQNMRERSLSDFAKGEGGRPRRDRRGSEGNPRRRRGRGGALRPTAGPQDVRAPLRANRQGGESGVVVSLVLWNEELEVKRLQKRLGLDITPIEVFSNDKRLSDLPAFATADT